jgi:uncharacterized protein YjbI with pentapeptide repeats
MLGDIKIKDRNGKTIHVGRFNSVKAAVEFASLTKRGLTGADLRWKQLIGLNLKGHRFAAIDFSGANLHKACLDSTVMSRCICDNTYFAKADFRNAFLSDNSFIRTNFEKADFTIGFITRNDVTGADFSFACFDTTWLSYQSFRSAIIDKTDFSKASFQSITGR